jgi:hypothetical protein
VAHESAAPEQYPEFPPLQPTHDEQFATHWAHEPYLSDPVQATCGPPLLLLLVPPLLPSSPVEPSGTYESWGP